MLQFIISLQIAVYFTRCRNECAEKNFGITRIYTFIEVVTNFGKTSKKRQKKKTFKIHKFKFKMSVFDIVYFLYRIIIDWTVVFVTEVHYPDFPIT